MPSTWTTLSPTARTLAGRAAPSPPGYLGELLLVLRSRQGQGLLTDAGYPDGFAVTVKVNNCRDRRSPRSSRPAPEVGITMNMNVVDHPTYQQIRKDASAIAFYGAARFPVADSYLTQFYHSAATVGTETAITNFSHCDVADAEIEAARKTADEAARLKLWAAAQKKIHDAVCAVRCSA